MVIYMKKDTGKLIEELNLCPDFHSFYCENKNYIVESSLSELLSQMMQDKGLRRADVIHASELSEVYAYQIFSGLRMPTRKKLLALAVGMKLTVDEVQRVLKQAGYPSLYIKLAFDSVVLYGIHKHLSVCEINQMLFEYDQECIG